jgi:hypothetical protein
MPKLLIKSLSSIKQDPTLKRTGEAFDDIVSGTSNLAAQLSADPGGADITPANVAQVTAQHLGNGLVDVAIVDNSSISRAINYHVEYDTSPSFSVNPRGQSLGPWRNGSVTLPNGTWYVRGYSQYPNGGPPSAPIVNPSPITVTGSAALPLLSSQGSGTGKAGQGGSGSGKTLTR